MALHQQNVVLASTNQTRLDFRPAKDAWVMRIGVVNVNAMSNYGLAAGPESMLEGQSIIWLKWGRSGDIGDGLYWTGGFLVPVGHVISGYLWPTFAGNRARFWVDYL